MQEPVCASLCIYIDGTGVANVERDLCAEGGAVAFFNLSAPVIPATGARERVAVVPGTGQVRLGSARAAVAVKAVMATSAAMVVFFFIFVSSGALVVSSMAPGSVIVYCARQQQVEVPLYLLELFFGVVLAVLPGVKGRRRFRY